MRRRGLWPLAAAYAVFCLCLVGRAEEPLEVNQLVAQAHYEYSVGYASRSNYAFRYSRGRWPRNYELGIRFLVGKDGRVKRTAKVSGEAPPGVDMTEVIRPWVFQPFTRNGVPTEAWVTFFWFFTTESMPSEQLKRDFGRAFDDCRSTTATAEARESACSHAMDVGAQLPSFFLRNDREESQLMLATTLLDEKHAKEAAAMGDDTIAMMLRFGGPPRLALSAYAVTGEAKALNGDLAGADKDLEQAEEFAALTKKYEKEAQAKWAADRQQSLLALHAKVLTALHRDADAEAKLRLAAQLK